MFSFFFLHLTFHKLLPHLLETSSQKSTPFVLQSDSQRRFWGGNKNHQAMFWTLKVNIFKYNIFSTCLPTCISSNRQENIHRSRTQHLACNFSRGFYQHTNWWFTQFLVEKNKTSSQAKIMIKTIIGTSKSRKEVAWNFIWQCLETCQLQTLRL